MTVKKLKTMQARYEILKTRLGKIGLMQVGTITRRMDRRPSATAPGGYTERGPYYQWTWKEKGKTRTRNLSARQSRAYGQAIRNHRKLERIVLEMRELSQEILEIIAAKEQSK